MIPSRALLSVFVLLGVVLPSPPSFEYVETVGCGDLFLMAWNKESSEVLSITLSGSPTDSREAMFDLKNSTERIRVPPS